MCGILPDGTAVMRRVVDADNSCLFNAVGYVMEGRRGRVDAAHLRCLPGTVLAGYCVCRVLCLQDIVLESEFSSPGTQTELLELGYDGNGCRVLARHHDAI